MAEKFDEFLEEVEKDIRQERLMNFWKKYQKIIVSFLILSFGSAGAYNLWQHYQTHKSERDSQKYIAAQKLLLKGQKDEALSVLSDLAENPRGSYGLLAFFLKAAVLGQDGGTKGAEEAQALYRQIEGDYKVEATFRELALLLRVGLQLDTSSLSTEDSLKLLAELEPLTAADNAWHCLALELKGFILQETGKMAEAAEVFASIAREQNLPNGMTIRSQIMSQLLAAEASQKGNAPAPAPTKESAKPAGN